MQTTIGVIGGSGVYDIAGLEGASWVKAASDFGQPSDHVLVGRLGGVAIAFLPRHGRGHVHSPATVPYRANIDALKRLGVTNVIAVSAVGSLRKDYSPGDLVVIDQYIDRTVARESSFFGPGCVAHVSVADPTCARLSATCHSAALAQGITVHLGSTYLAMEGPQFSTRAESQLYRSWGCDVIGMPEAKLAHEAELCYASWAMVTDYDCWHQDHGAVDVAQVIATLAANAGAARRVIAALPGALGQKRAPCPRGCNHALDHALMTAPEKRDPALLKRLEAITRRVMS
jgi:5'-methylthioadenosine phosphorylase